MLAQITLYFSNSFAASIRIDISLLFLSPYLTLGIIKTNGLIASSKYSIKYLELVFVLPHFEIAISSTLTSQIFIDSFCRIKLLSLQILTLFYYQKKLCDYFLAN